MRYENPGHRGWGACVGTMLSVRDAVLYSHHPRSGFTERSPSCFLSFALVSAGVAHTLPCMKMFVENATYALHFADPPSDVPPAL